MHVWGLHIVDFGILVGFLLMILAMGVWVSRSVKHEGDFYLGGRKMGRTLQFFLNFGNATDSNGAVTTASEVFRQGMGGIWMSLQTLFITPFYWFTQVWFRRARVITMADMWVDRFNSKRIAGYYAVFNIMVALLQLGVGTKIGYELAASMIVKPESAYTQLDRQHVDDFHEYQALQKEYEAGRLPEDKKERLGYLTDLQKRGNISSSVSYVPKLGFYFVYSGVIALYIMLGGLKAAAITDAVQGLLILFMSFILIPIGLKAVGGFSGLHDSPLVPQHYFELTGSPAMSEYTWYTIFFITLGSFIQILALSHNMASAGSAKDEDTARFGMLTGGFTKRVIIVAWSLCGLIGVAILMRPEIALSEPDRAWGTLSRVLLGGIPGLFGLMLAGMLLGHMPSVGMTSVAVAGLVTRNLYEPLFPGRDPKHYLRVGQWIVPLILALSIVVAWRATGIIPLMQTLITFNIYFGAVVVLTFFWRRLTVPAILAGFFVWIILIGAIPMIVPMTGLSRAEALLVETTERWRPAKLPATAEDVAANLAIKVGQVIEKPYRIAPKPVFFEKIVRVDPAKPELGRVGQGRFLVENYILYTLGFPFRTAPTAAVMACRWAFDSLFPFAFLILISLVTKPSAPERAPAFYAKLKTPVAPTPEEDHAEVEISRTQPDRFDHEKLFPATNWEFTKWTMKDVKGFFGCWGIVLLILCLLYAVVTVGSPKDDYGTRRGGATTAPTSADG